MGANLPPAPVFSTVTSGPGRLHIPKRRALAEAWSKEWAGRGWTILYPRDPDRDGPAWADPQRQIRERRAYKGAIKASFRAAHARYRAEPMPPGPDAGPDEWAEWERRELEILSKFPAWKRMAASAKTSAGLRKRARLLSFMNGKPLWWVSRAAGIQRYRLSCLLRGKAINGKRLVLGFREARRLSRALSITLEQLAVWIDSVELDPIV